MNQRNNDGVGDSEDEQDCDPYRPRMYGAFADVLATTVIQQSLLDSIGDGLMIAGRDDCRWVRSAPRAQPSR